MALIPKSTAYVRTFKMIDSSDHISKKTGLTCTVNIAKAGGSFAAAGGTVTEMANGWYKIALTTTDTNTAGDLSFYITATGADDTDFVDQVGMDGSDSVRGGMTALPNTAVTTNSSLLTSGTGTDQLSVSAGKVLLQATQTGVTIPTVTTVTNQLTAAAIATGVWQDATAGDFTTASSIGKSLYTSGVVPGAAGGLFIAGTNAATTVTTSFTTTFTGNLTGSVASVTGAVGSVTGAVGSVTGNVGGNVVGSVASVTARVTANTDQIGGNAATAAGAIRFPTVVAAGIQKNTAFNNFPIAMSATGLTVTTTFYRDGADGAASTNATSEVGHNMYKNNLAAADVNANVLGIKNVDNLGNVQWFTLFLTA